MTRITRGFCLRPATLRPAVLCLAVLCLAVLCLAATFSLAAGHLEITDARVYPTPFNPAKGNATIVFDLTEDADLEVTAYDWNGDFVDQVFKGPKSAGPNTVEWGGQTEDGRKLGNGVYLIRVVAATDARKESVVLKSVVWND